MVLSKGQPPEDGIEYYGEGTEAGQCGVHIAKIKEIHDGVFKCTLTPTDSRAEVQASVKIIVASTYFSYIFKLLTRIPCDGIIETEHFS